MKTIKIILGIVIAISVVFFATGLFVKETKYQTKIEINKPLNEVFIDFNDETLLKKWTPELVASTPIETKKSTTFRNKSYLMGCVYPYFKSRLQKIEKQYLNRFKKVTE